MTLIVSALLSLFAVAQGQCPCRQNESLAIAYASDGCLCACITYDPLRCGTCPENLGACAEKCCFQDNVACDEDGACRTDTLDFVTAAKIAVLFALTVTCLAAVVAIFRAFLLPLCRSRANNAPSFSQSDNRSLNSVQRYVLDRLTNRPPPYEHTPDKPPTYEECLATGVSTDALPPYQPPAVDADLPPYTTASNLQTETPILHLITNNILQSNQSQPSNSLNEGEGVCYNSSATICPPREQNVASSSSTDTFEAGSATESSPADAVPEELRLAIRPSGGFGSYCRVVMAQTQDGDAQPAGTHNPVSEQDVLQAVLSLLTEPPPVEQDAAALFDQNRRLRSVMPQLTASLRDKSTLCMTLERKVEALNVQVTSLKDVVSLNRELLQIRNSELQHLQSNMDGMQSKMTEMRTAHNEVIAKLGKAVSLNEQLKTEYGTQLKLFESLKEKYKHRAELMDAINEHRNTAENNTSDS